MLRRFNTSSTSVITDTRPFVQGLARDWARMQHQQRVLIHVPSLTVPEQARLEMGGPRYTALQKSQVQLLLYAAYVLHSILHICIWTSRLELGQ